MSLVLNIYDFLVQNAAKLRLKRFFVIVLFMIDKAIYSIKKHILEGKDLIRARNPDNYLEKSTERI